VALLLADGTRLSAAIADQRAGWWLLETDEGTVWVQLAHVVLVGSEAAVPAGGRRGRGGGGSTSRSRSSAPGRPWSDDELRMLADAFLDGAVDKDLAREFGRTPAIVKQLRQGFECARGNLDEERVTEIAASWVPRWRRVLAG